MCALVTGVQTCALPIFAFDNPQTLATARHMLAEEILRDRNRASIAIWSVGNETPVSDARNAFLTMLAQDAHALDDSRLVSAALRVGRKEEGGQSVLSVDDPLIPAPAAIGRAIV